MHEKPRTLREAVREQQQPAQQRLPGQGPAPKADPDTLAGYSRPANEANKHEHNR
jgi:hypothetical protein